MSNETLRCFDFLENPYQQAYLPFLKNMVEY